MSGSQSEYIVVTGDPIAVDNMAGSIVQLPVCQHIREQRRRLKLEEERIFSDGIAFRDLPLLEKVNVPASKTLLEGVCLIGLASILVG